MNVNVNVNVNVKMNNNGIRGMDGNGSGMRGAQVKRAKVMHFGGGRGGGPS